MSVVQTVAVWHPTDWRRWPAMTIPIEDHAAESVHDLKVKVAGLYGISPDSFDLVRGDSPLTDEARTLDDHGVPAFGFLEVRPR
jgi:hypothetical protein